MAQYHDVWVITRHIWRDQIDAELARNPQPRLNFIYVDARNRRVRRPRDEVTQVYYYYWQVLAYREAKRSHSQIGFDLVHHITFQKYWAPSFLVMLPVPFIWGPVGGGEGVGMGFWSGFGPRGIAYEALRDTARWIGERDPFVKLTTRKADYCLATTRETSKRMERLGAKQVEIYPAIGLSGADADRLGALPDNRSGPLRFLCLGRLIHWKGFDLAIQAFARATLPDAELWLVGDGSEKARFQSLAEDLGIAGRVHFLGNLPRKDALEKLAACDVLVHPSLHESGGLCCVEAMAARRPVICLDLGGPSIQVTPDSGIAVPAPDRKTAVEGLSEAMRRLAEDPELRSQLGAGARARILDHYLWDRKVKYYCEIYDQVLGRAHQKTPDQADTGARPASQASLSEKSLPLYPLRESE